MIKNMWPPWNILIKTPLILLFDTPFIQMVGIQQAVILIAMKIFISIKCDYLRPVDALITQHIYASPNSTII